MCRQRCFHKARANQAHANLAVLEVDVKRFGQVDQCGLGWAISQAFGQATVAGHAADQADVTCLAAEKMRQHRVENMQGAYIVDLLVSEHFAQVKRGGAHFLVVASAVKHQIQRSGRQNGLRGRVDGDGVADVNRQGYGARMLCRKSLKCLLVARRHKNPGATGMQGMCRGLAYAAGRADQPDAFAAPVSQERVVGHGITFSFTKVIASYAHIHWAKLQFDCQISV